MSEHSVCDMPIKYLDCVCLENLDFDAHKYVFKKLIRKQDPRSDQGGVRVVCLFV